MTAPPPGPRRGALALLAATQLLLITDTAIVNVALPSIGADLGPGPTGLSWVANAYLITFGGLLLLGGRIADLLGHRRVLLAGLALLALASACGGLAPGAAALVAARAAQGAGAALAAASAFALLLLLFPEGPARHRALGAFAAMGGLGGVLGTVGGGVLTGVLGWRSTFWLNVLLAAALGALALRVLDGGTGGVRTGAADRSGRRHRGGFDLAGALTATAGLGLVAYALVGAAGAGWLSARTLTAGGAGLALLLAFAAVETRAAAPLVPPAVLRRPALGLANLLAALAQMTLFPMFFLVSLHLQSVLGYGPLGGGLGLLPLSLAVVAVAPQTGRIIFRLGLPRTTTLGFVLLCAGTLWLALALRADGTFASTVLAPGLLLGVALPLVVVTTNVAATAEAAPGENGLASGLVNTSQQFGSVLGLAVLVAVAAGRTGAADASRAVAETAGHRAALLTGAALAAAAALLSLRLHRGEPAAGAAPARAPDPGTPDLRTPDPGTPDLRTPDLREPGPR
ncbi:MULTISPECIES: MFS transporter [unclassified Streptomyces]|uniref:MFS transporter n=1 Tax=unclassified Streptomyces TaxID=2593676 RepID=UPI0007014CB8|nr:MULTISPECIES: MFS transporter [unclassified Streptomyces]KQX47408.1 MFS transporter [Streptomyces sp. Root1304]KRA94715.1 MFS transporter [Streptomyces sp. Root66D1]